MRLTEIQRVERVPFVTALCLGKTVLNLGCADATRVDDLGSSDEHLHTAIRAVASRLVGIDTNSEGLASLARQTGATQDELLQWDIERLAEAPDLGTFEVVVAGEVIEHVRNPGLMLAGIRSALERGGTLVITTPNALALKFFLSASIRRIDISSDHHTLMFSFKTLDTLLKQEGFHPVARAVAQWRLPSARSRVFARFFSLIAPILPQLGDTIIIVARPIEGWEPIANMDSA